MTVAQLKEQYRLQLFEFGKKLNSNQKMQIALDLQIAFLTVTRYMSGKIEDVRNAELAEEIINACKRITEKQTA